MNRIPVVVLLTMGCLHLGSTGPSVALCVEEVVVAPTKGGGQAWDPGQVPPEAMAAVAGGGPGPAIAAALGAIAGTASSSPDIEGHLTAQAPGMEPVRVELPVTYRNSFRQLWSASCPQMTSLPLWGDVRVALTLADDDSNGVNPSDPIGVVSISGADLRGALRRGAIYSVPVEEQADGAVVYLGISVVRQ